MIRYKNFSIFVENKNYDILQGKHTVAVGLANQDEDSLFCAKRLIDANFETAILPVIRMLPTTKR